MFYKNKCPSPALEQKYNASGNNYIYVVTKSPNQRFYRSDEQYRQQIEKTLAQKRKASEITDSDEQIIRAFIAELRATKGISDVRAAKLCSNITGLRRWTPPFDEMTTPDVYLASDKIRNAGFKKNSEADIIRALKRVCLWICENGQAAPGLQIEKVRLIKTPGYDSATKDVSDLLTPEQVMDMITHARNIRNQAIISTLYEGGFRIGEIGNLQWSQIKFHEEHATISTDFKTGKQRAIPLYNSLGYLKSWLNQFPGNSSAQGAFVFVARGVEPFTYDGLRKVIQRAADKAGITRKITPHTFRHSRITHLIKEGWKESVIKKMMWGSVESDMFKTYLHLCEDDVADEAAERMGVRRRGRPTNESKKLEPIQCLSCGTVNPFTHRFCSACGTPLTPEAGDRMKLFIKTFESDPRFKIAKEAAEKALMEMGI